MLKGRERINPALVRELFEFDMTRPHVDFYEKVNGKWVITVLADSSSISGGIKTRYYIPNNNGAYQHLASGRPCNAPYVYRSLREQKAQQKYWSGDHRKDRRWENRKDQNSHPTRDR